MKNFYRLGRKARFASRIRSDVNRIQGRLVYIGVGLIS